MSNKIHKELYKGFTLFVNDTHFGAGFSNEDETPETGYKVPLQEGFSLKDHIVFLKNRIDLYTKR